MNLTQEDIDRDIKQVRMLPIKFHEMQSLIYQLLTLQILLQIQEGLNEIHDRIPPEEYRGR